MKLRSQKLMLFTLVLLILMVLTTPPTSFALQNATLSVDPPSGTITSPTYTINVNISHVEDLWAIHFQLSFNDGIDFLRVEIPEGVEPVDLMTTQATVDSHVASVGGISYLDVTLLAPDWQNNGTVTGAGNIAKITFNLMENAQPEMTSWLKLELADATVFTGTNFELIPTTLESGTVTVGLLTTTLTLDMPTTATVEKPITLSANLTDGDGNPIAGQTINYYVNSQKLDDSDATDTYGVASIMYTPAAVGTLYVQAVYNGSLIYAGSSTATVQVTVSKMVTTLILSVPWTIEVGDTVDLIAILLKDTYPIPTPIVGATVSFSILPTGWTASETTNSSGIASAKYTFNIVAYYEIKAKYLGTEKYTSSNDTVERPVASTKTTLTLTAPFGLFFGKADEPTTISAILKDENQNLLANFDIYFYIYTEPPTKIGGTTNSSGVASIEYIPQIAGGFQVEAIYEGNLTYTASSSSLGWIQVVPISTNLALSAPTATVDKSTVITATLKDEKGNPIDKQPVHFYVDSEEIEGSPTNTTSSGVASINFTPTAARTFQVEAMYNGSAKYANSSDTADLTVERLATTLSLNVPASARVEDQIALIATLKDQDQEPIPYAIIDYEIKSIGWNPLDTAFTNESGVASLDYIPTQAATFKIRAKFGGNPKNAESTSPEASLTVRKVNTTLTISVPTTTTVKKSITISATLKDENGKPLPDSIVYFFNNATGDWVGIDSTPTNPNGIASMNYQPDMTGTFKLKTTYKGDQKYTGSTSSEATLEVTSGESEPETQEKPFWSFLIDEKLTMLDILFWLFLILSFVTLVVAIIWKKIK